MTIHFARDTAPAWVRKYAPGYIGGAEVADKATNHEVLALVDIQNRIARLLNKAEDERKRFENIARYIQSRQGGKKNAGKVGKKMEGAKVARK